VNLLTTPDLVAFLSAAHADGTVDLQRAVDDYVRTAIEHSSPELRDAYLNRWFDNHAGNSLVAYLHDGRITGVEEMATADADMQRVFDPDGQLIVATWVGVS
jgi:hypothetical protein